MYLFNNGAYKCHFTLLFFMRVFFFPPELVAPALRIQRRKKK